MSISRTFNNNFNETYDLFEDFPKNKHFYPSDVTSNDQKLEYMVIEAINIKSSNYLKSSPDKAGKVSNSQIELVGKQRKFRRPKKDQKATLVPETTFFLPMAQIVSDKLDHTWGEKENIIDGAGGGSVGDFLGSAVKEGISGVKKKLTESFVPNSIKANEGLAVDKKLALLFDITQKRQFNFIFNMSPRSEDECREVIAIMRKLKYYSSASPTEIKGFSFFEYPDVFRIYYYRDGVINENLNKIDTCALVSYFADFTPNQVWSQFSNGFPINVRLTLSFKELNTLTKQHVRKGY